MSLIEPTATAGSQTSVRAPTSASPAATVIVACDGSATCQESLLNAARLVGRTLSAQVEVLGVCAPTPALLGGIEMVAPSVQLDESRRQAMLEDIRRSISVHPSGDVQWPAEVQVGPPALTLASEARRRSASMLVMGIGRHNPLDRLFGTETTLATLRESTVPILAVGLHFPSTPKFAVVGIDFSPASVLAARLALDLLGAEGRLTLVHVRPRFEHPSDEWQAWDTDYGRTLPPLFDQLRAQLSTTGNVTIETVTIRGDPAPALIAYAQQNGAELIALGAQRHGVIERLVVGSVATRVLRTARCAVLAVPASAAAAIAAPVSASASIDSGKAA